MAVFAIDLKNAFNTRRGRVEKGVPILVGCFGSSSDHVPTHSRTSSIYLDPFVHQPLVINILTRTSGG